MPFNVTSSQIGVDLNNTSTTALFTLNQTVFGSNETQWQYVKVSGACTTGMLVTIAAGGTAIAATTLSLTTNGGAQAGGVALGWCQGNFADQDYGWVVQRGMGVTVGISGSAAPGVPLYLAATPGWLSTTAQSATMAGILLTTSASTASLVVSGVATLQWPRCVGAIANGIA